MAPCLALRVLVTASLAPAYDGPGQQTALLAASIAYELLALRAVARR